MRHVYRALPLLMLLACSSFMDVEKFELLAPFEELPLSTITTAAPYDLWELRAYRVSGTHAVIAGGGTVSRSAVPPALLAEFDDTESLSGFDPGCLPSTCYKYFVTLKGAVIDTWTSIQEVRAFLGTIDSRVEAAVMAKAHGYYWEAPTESAGIRDIDGEYELVVLDLVEFCEPVQIDRFLLRISTTGEVRILKQQTWDVSGGCI